jgi:hypothetical protein
MVERLSSNQPEASDISGDGQPQETRPPFLSDYLMLSDLAPIVGYDPSHLRRLLAQGKIEGHKLGNGRGTLWLTTEQAVREYQMRGNNNGSRVGRPRKQPP